MRLMRQALLTSLPIILLGCPGDPVECDGVCGSDPEAPTFAGAVSVAPDATGTRLRVTWAAASDDKTAADAIRYRVYAALHSGQPTRSAAVVTTSPGATSAIIAVSPPGARHFVVVRAVDAEDHEDSNVVEKSALAVADTTPPTFAGLQEATPGSDARIALTWEAASDDLTPPEGMRYEVTESNAGGAAAVIAVVEGATQITLPHVGRAKEPKLFSVRAHDAAGNRDANTVTLDRPIGSDVRKPVFAGCAAAELHGVKTVRASWTPASDETTAPEAIAYDIYVSAGAPAFDKAPAATVTGASSAVVTGLLPDTTYRIVCRARDAAGNHDDNTVEKTVSTGDVAPPAFDGLTSATLDAALREVTIAWLPATDAKTPQNELVYVVYQSTTAGVYDFASPPAAVSAAGATSVKLTGLPSATTLFWTVRARDAFFNEDTNTVEASGTTLVSYSRDIGPLFAKNCAVVGCHVSANPTGGMSLSASVAYSSIVGVPANQKPPGRVTPINRITAGDPAESYVLLKIKAAPGTFVGSAMPAPGTGTVISDADKLRLQDWIAQGALEN
jgi:hypothetical protein